MLCIIYKIIPHKYRFGQTAYRENQHIQINKDKSQPIGFSTNDKYNSATKYILVYPIGTP